MDGYDDIAAQEAAQRSGTAPPPVDDTYDAMAAAEAEQRRNALKQSLLQATKVSPVKAGEVQALADRSGLPQGVVERNQDQVAQQQRAREIYEATQASPILRRQLTDPAFAKLAQDDVSNLSGIESLTQSVQSMLRHAAAGATFDVGSGAYGVAETALKNLAPILDPLAGRILPVNPLRVMAEKFEQWRKSQQELAYLTAGGEPSGGFIEQSIQSGFRSTGQMAPGLAAAIATRDPRFALGMGGAMQGSQSATKALDVGKSPLQALAYGMEDAVAEVVTEKLPMGVLIRDLNAGATFKRVLAHQIATEVPTEIAATAWQNANEWANLNPEKTLKDYLKELGPAEAQTVIATVTQTVLTAGLGKIGHHVLMQRLGEDQAGKDADTLKRLLQMSGASAVRERSPATFTQFVNAASAEGPLDAVYVNPHVFAQGAAEAGIDVATHMPETAAAIPEAIAAGTDVRIPLGEFATAIPGTTFEQSIIPHLRTSEDGPTQAEAADKQWSEETKAATERILAEQNFDQTWKDSAAKVEADILDQLQHANRFTADVNRAYAGLTAAFYATQAHRMGLTPEQMYAEAPLRIQAAGLIGPGTLTQEANTPEFKKWFGDSKVVDAEGKPLVVYHGTNAQFDVFNRKRASKKTGNPNAQIGFFFTSDQVEANRYATAWSKEGSNVVPAYLSLKNPYEMSYREFDDLAMLPFNRIKENFDRGFTQADVKKWNAEARAAARKRRDELIAQGYDGVVTRTTNGTVTEYVAFNPEQIKSAVGNRGAFDPNKPSILDQPALEDTFYSVLTRQIESAKMATAPAAQWKSFINGLSSKGVKKDEIMLSGVMDWLDIRARPEFDILSMGKTLPVRAMSRAEAEQFLTVSHPGIGVLPDAKLVERPPQRVAKQEVIDYLNDKGVRVETEVLGPDDETEPEYEEDEDAIYERARELWNDQLEEEARESVRDSDYMRYDVKLLLPKARVVELPADMLRKGNKFGVQELDYGDTKDVTEVSELGEPRATWADRQEFKTREKAEHYIAQSYDDNVDEPAFAALFEDDGVGDAEHFDTNDEAEKDGENRSVQRYEYEVQSYIDNTNFSDVNTDYWMVQARDELGEGATRRRKSESETRHAGQYQSEGGRGYVEIVIGVPGIEPFRANDSTHFGDVFKGRTVAWARGKIHDAPDGKPVFFIEEIQSQRAQAGRESGFIDLAAKTKLQAEYNALTERVDAIDARRGHIEATREPGTMFTTEYVELTALRADLMEQRRAVQERELGTVPPAPFVTDTKSWTALVLKQVLRHAIDVGAERVQWTPGSEQVQRYQSALRKRVDTIVWEKTPEGIKINATQHGRVMLAEQFPEKELRTAIGPLMADKIIDDPNQSGTLEGRDIAIDDTGMEKFYGDIFGTSPEGKPAIITQVANQIVKSLGGEPVKGFELPLVEEGKEWDTAPGFEITDKMRETVLKGLPLFQGSASAPRGNITFGDNITQQPSVITLLAGADLSTFLHESGHFYLEVMNHMAALPNAPQEVKDDFDKIMAWFGTTADAWRAMTLEQKRPYHEQWARGFESYLFEGNAPSAELQTLFGRFRAWMLNVYRQLTALKVELTPEVRGVMDRMLATNDEIVAAERARNMMPLYATKPPGMTDQQWQRYHADGVAATQAGVDQLQSRSLRDMKWTTGARGRALAALQKDAAVKRKGIRAEVTAEVNAEPIYAAEYGLKNGWKQDDGSTIELKLNTGALAEMYPEGMANRPDLSKLRGMTNAETGLHPDQVAELTGFTSGDELIRKLTSAEPRQSVIEGKTDQRMLERYGDLADPAALARAADAAIHNEARAKFVATEMHALDQATGKRGILNKAAKEFAAAIIARRKIRDIKTSPYAAAATRAAKAAERALAANKIEEAAGQKRTQLVNIYATKAAHDAIDEVDRNVAYLKRVGESKTIDPEYREQINALLERFDLRAVSARETARRESLTQWIEAQREKGLEPVIDPELENEANRKPYRELPLEDFRGLVDAVRNIEHLGRLKNKLLTAKDKRDFAMRVESLRQSIVDNAKRTLPAKLERNTWTDEMKSGTAEFFAWHRKFSMMARELDGHKDNGEFWNLLVRTMNEAGDKESVMREAATIRMQQLFAPIVKTKLREKLFIPAIDNSLSREGRIMVALNTGNDGNLQRLMDGDGWMMPQVQAIVDTLTKQEMDFVQSIWDFVGEYRQQIGDQQKRLTGIEPKWVEPRKVITPHGEYAGGYLPAKYDTTRSSRSLADEAVSGLMDQWRAKRGAAGTRASFTKERANKVVGRPLRKDLNVITQHVTEVTHRLAWQDYLTDATRLLRAKAIDGAIREHYGPEVLKALKDTIEDVAAGEVPAQNAFERAVNYLRTGATIAGLGWRITTSLLQPIGLTQSMVRIGPKWVGKGLVEWLGDATRMENTAKRIFEKSSMMRLRAKTLQREISEIRNQISGKSSAITASYFYLITKLQLVADVPTWLGQYNKAVEGGADESNAIAQADQAVLDAQGGGQIKDLAGVQRGGPMLKLFTNFYSFFNTTYNLTGMAVGRTKFTNPLSVGLLAVDIMLLYSVPAALGTLMKAALHSGDDDQDEKKLLRQLIADQLTYLLGTMVGVREVAGTAQAALGLPGDYQGPAGVRLLAELAKLGKQIQQGEVDEALLKAANETGGILFHYPAGQINATADGLYTMAQGKTENPGALVVGSNKK